MRQVSFIKSEITQDDYISAFQSYVLAAKFTRKIMKVAIIGAGASGLTALKQCKDEGIEGVILEKENYIGGLWRFNGKIID